VRPARESPIARQAGVLSDFGPTAAGMLVATADLLLLLGLPWYLMQAFRSLDALTLKAAYATCAMAAAVLGEWAAHHLQRTGRLTVSEPGGRRRVLAVLALFLAVLAGVLGTLQGNWFINVPVVTAGAGISFFLAAIALPTPLRSFPFGPRSQGATTRAEMDRFAFGAVLAALLLTFTGPAGEFLVAGVIYAAVAAFSILPGVPVAAAQATPAPATAPPLVDTLVDRAANFLGAAGLRQAPAVTDLVTLAFQILFGLTVYKIKVHMEFSALAIGLLVACGAAGEYVAEAGMRWVKDNRAAAVGAYAGAVVTIGMFAGLAGNAFPPVVFLFWAGVTAAAHWNDRCRGRLEPHGQATAQRLRLQAALAIVTAGWLVWWISTWLAKPHSINLVLTLTGVMIGLRVCAGLLPSAIGQAGKPPARTASSGAPGP
jgi:hypothetical protein